MLIKRFYKQIVSALMLVVSPYYVAHAEDNLLRATEAKFDLTFETLTLDEFQGETMGLLGGNFLFQLDDYPWLSLGAASYGTVTGERGGFITLGLASDAKISLADNFSAHTGLFVGAGGGHGGYQLQGGGFMLRGHMGLSMDSRAGNASVGLSRVSFPNGHVDSSQVYASYSYDFQTLLGEGWLEPKRKYISDLWPFDSNHHFGVVYRTYDVPQGVKNASGGAQFSTVGLVGVEWQHELNDWLFMSIESEGAMQGQSNGYMQILLGAGMFYEVVEGSSLKISASAGVAGGGNVDTGGGLLTDVGIGVQTKLSEGLSLEIEAAWADSVLSEFKARSLAIKFSQSYTTPFVTADDELDITQLQNYAVKHLRVRLVNQTYIALPSSTETWRTHHANRDVNLLGFQTDYFIGQHVFLTGQGIAAYEGQAGGYMTGLVGIGASYPLHGVLTAEAEALVGAAGGGGLAVGGGLVWQVNAGLSYQYSDDYSVLLEAGRIKAVKGEFAANVLSLAASYHFSLFMK